MPMGRPRFLTTTTFALLFALSLSACAGVTGPSRRHLAAVEAAERALTLPSPERRRALESARDELRAVLDTTPGLAGAKLSLATVHARLDEPKLALELAPPLDEQRPEERPGWSALETWALARAGRWDELIARQPDGELAALATRYRDFAVAPTPCDNPTATTTPTPVSSQPATCCAEPASLSLCRDCLAAARDAWCQGAPTDQILALTGRTAPSPVLELARARLRAAALASAGRHDEARLMLEAAREAAEGLAALSLDLDRAILLAWSGELEKSRALLTTLQAASPPEPLLSRLRGLAEALAPPSP